jgi:hypothetical protein
MSLVAISMAGLKKEHRTSNAQHRTSNEKNWRLIPGHNHLGRFIIHETKRGYGSYRNPFFNWREMVVERFRVPSGPQALWAGGRVQG